MEVERAYEVGRIPNDLESPWRDDGWAKYSQQLMDSYRHWIGDELVSRAGSVTEQAERLFRAPAIVVSHGTEPDPILCYGNLAALRLWELSLIELLAMPSRLTAEPVERSERQAMLSRGLDHGFIRDYSGIRISSTGRRFLVRQATIWNVLDERGERIGQAATFSDWADP